MASKTASCFPNHMKYSHSKERARQDSASNRVDGDVRANENFASSGKSIQSATFADAEDIWAQLDPTARTRTVNILAQMAYSFISANSNSLAEHNHSKPPDAQEPDCKICSD